MKKELFGKEGGKPLYLQVYKRIKSEIETGRLTPGMKLPSKRKFAENLGVSVITIENAYEKLVSEGYIYSRPQSGFYVEKLDIVTGKDQSLTLEVSDSKYEKKDEGIRYDFTSNRNVNELFPLSTWSKVARRVIAEEGQNILNPAPPHGARVLRRAIARHLWEFRGMNVNPDNIVIGAGTEYLYGILVQLLGRDKIYALEDPGYIKISKVYKANDVKIVYIPFDENGIDTGKLSEADADILHISPTYHFPTGESMLAGKRYELLRIAEEKENRFIIEDDFDSELRQVGTPMPTFMQMDRSGRVIYMNTFTKTLSPTIRVAYMVLPDELAREFHEKLGFYNCSVSNFQQYLVAEFINEGYFASHINRLRRYYKKEREVLLSELDKSVFLGMARVRERESGLQLLIDINLDCSDEAIREAALRAGVRVATLSQYYIDGNKGRGVLFLNYSSIPVSDIPDAVRLLDEALRSVSEQAEV